MAYKSITQYTDKFEQISGNISKLENALQKDTFSKKDAVLGSVSLMKEALENCSQYSKILSKEFDPLARNMFSQNVRKMSELSIEIESIVAGNMVIPAVDKITHDLRFNSAQLEMQLLLNKELRPK